MSVNWPHLVKPTENLTAQPVGDKVFGLDIPESKSPMKYAVDYVLTDEDGQIIAGTDHFIMKEFAWDRLEELAKLSGINGQLTIRSL